MTSPLDVMIELRRKAERTARADLERATAARIAADEREACLVEVLRAAMTTLRRTETRRLSGPTSAAQAQTRERYRARLQAEAARATQAVEQHRRGDQAAARSAEDEARATYAAAHAALAAVQKLALRATVKLARRANRQAEDAASDRAAHVQRARRRQ